MKKIVPIIISLILVITLISCTKEQNIKLIIEKRIENSNEYEEPREITDEESLDNISDILNNIKWENAKVDMVHSADYIFHFKTNKSESRGNSRIYALWISPNKEQVEIIIDTESKYVQLDKGESNKLLEILQRIKLIKSNFSE